jgi:hypothetical protein
MREEPWRVISSSADAALVLYGKPLEISESLALHVACPGCNPGTLRSACTCTISAVLDQSSIEDTDPDG